MLEGVKGFLAIGIENGSVDGPITFHAIGADAQKEAKERSWEPRSGFDPNAAVYVIPAEQYPKPPESYPSQQGPVPYSSRPGE